MDKEIDQLSDAEINDQNKLVDVLYKNDFLTNNRRIIRNLREEKSVVKYVAVVYFLEAFYQKCMNSKFRSAKTRVEKFKIAFCRFAYGLEKVDFLRGLYPDCLDDEYVLTEILNHSKYDSYTFYLF